MFIFHLDQGLGAKLGRIFLVAGTNGRQKLVPEKPIKKAPHNGGASQTTFRFCDYMLA